jgi:hypothetical protein
VPSLCFQGPFGIASYPRPADGSEPAIGAPEGSITKVINNEFMIKSTGFETYPDMSTRVIPGKMPAPKDTNSNRLKMSKPVEPAKEPFVMKRFQGAQARVVTK